MCLSSDQIQYLIISIIVIIKFAYLFRKGSTPYVELTLRDRDCIAYLQYAKEHSEHIAPCKDTGLMYYLEANLYSKVYELTPSKEMKENVLNSIEHAMAQFDNEEEDIRQDYKRMLMLRKAYCYLGLNLFGKKITGASVEKSDRISAKKCLDFVEITDIWTKMESRRKMLYYIAKAEYYREEQIPEMALMFAKMAEENALKNGWTAELPNIKKLLCSCRCL